MHPGEETSEEASRRDGKRGPIGHACTGSTAHALLPPRGRTPPRRERQKLDSKEEQEAETHSHRADPAVGSVPETVSAETGRRVAPMPGGQEGR